MKIVTMTAIAVALCGSSAFAQNSANIPPLNQGQQAAPPAASGTQNQAQNPMPGTTGGFNNNEINGKSRNPDTTTPGTGPANADPNQKQ
jgi:hypothetical protein